MLSFKRTRHPKIDSLWLVSGKGGGGGDIYMALTGVPVVSVPSRNE